MRPAGSVVAERMGAVLAAHAPSDAWSSRLGWGVVPDADGEPWVDLAAIEEPEAAHWLAIEMDCERARGMDARAAAAYLVGRLGSALSLWLVRLRSEGLALGPGPAGGVLARPRLVAWEHEGETGVAPVFDLWIAPGLAVDGQEGAPALGRVVVALMRPLIETAHAVSGLAAAALWRQLADGVTGAFLEHGKAHGVVGRAMADARAAIAPPSPLWNKQVGFVEVRRSADVTLGRQERCEWFRVRGGCCRYHTLDGGEYCSTCVHRDPRSREARLLDFMRESSA